MSHPDPETPHQSPKTTTFEQAFEVFLTYREAEGRSSKTIRDYVDARRRWQEYRKERGVPGDLGLLEEVHVVGFIQWLRSRRRNGRPLSDHSVGFYFRGVRTFLNWCVRKGYLGACVIAHVREPKAADRLPELLTEAEVGRLVDACVRPVDRLVLTLLLDTGIRVSELVGLTYADTDLEGSGLRVLGKGNKERIVTLSEAGRAAIEAWIADHPGDPGRLLLWGCRGPLTASGVEQILRRLRRRTGLRKRIYPHLLRHTFATFYLKNGGNVHGLKDELGHSTLEMAKRYVHLAYDDRREVKQRVSIIQRLNNSTKTA